MTQQKQTNKAATLRQLVAKKCKSIAQDWAKMTAEQLESAPAFVGGKDGRKWKEYTLTKKRAIIRDYFKDRKVKAIKELQNLANNTETVREFESRTEWHKSRTWGYNPSTRVWVRCSNYYYGEGRASGCGYDKLSASIMSGLSKEAERAICGEIVRKYNKTRKPLPYGVYVGTSGLYLSFGGCGVETLRGILNYIGFKQWQHISGDTFDAIIAKK